MPPRRGCDFLRPVEQALEIDRQATSRSEPGGQALKMADDLPLIVRRAASMEAAAVDDSGKRGRAPGAQRTIRLNVIMTVEEHSRPPRR